MPAGSLGASGLDPLIHTRSTEGFSNAVSSFCRTDGNVAVN